MDPTSQFRAQISGYTATPPASTLPTPSQPPTNPPSAPTTLNASQPTMRPFVQVALSSQQSTAKIPPTPPQGIKREAEDPMEALLAKPEAPWARRTKIFNALATVVPPKTDPEKARTIVSADNLTDYELKECYDIARAAMAAQFDHRKVTAAVMEDFLKAVFDDWNALKDAPVIHKARHFPFESQTVPPTKTFIGTFTLGKSPTWSAMLWCTRQLSSPISRIDREVFNVQHWMTLTAADDDISLRIEVVRPEKPNSRKRVSIGTEDIHRVVWKSPGMIANSKEIMRKAALITLVDQLATYNRERAVKYARSMLHHQTLGTATPAPCSGRYEFARLSTTLHALPLLEESDLEHGDRTVILFSKAELSADFEGTEAVLGKKCIKVATGPKNVA